VAFIFSVLLAPRLHAATGRHHRRPTVTAADTAFSLGKNSGMSFAVAWRVRGAEAAKFSMPEIGRGAGGCFQRLSFRVKISAYVPYKPNARRTQGCVGGQLSSTPTSQASPAQRCARPTRTAAATHRRHDRERPAIWLCQLANV
jgi:hypothetical protein